jgi:hypothetical protein
MKNTILATLKTPAARAYYRRVAWTLNGNIPGMAKTVRKEVERLNK